ncbi:PAS domain-containing sensor histidine kinase [Desulfatiglans anilini]|uniref:PAS domain-containing sensor histidine kinase n=1 Tax=Desulfatiglans anilini TaxID=90728 RepID=UPI000401C1AB|nr:PAS domain S-box protein [Desulfatiglans anilini]
MDKEKRMLASIVESIDEGVYVIDPDFTVEYMNRTMIEYFGQGVGEKCHKVINDQDTLCPWCWAHETPLSKERRGEIYIPKVNRTFEVTEKPVAYLDGSQSRIRFFKDITDRKRREAELRLSEEKFRSLFEHVNVGVYISSKEGKFLDANRALLQMLGYDTKEEFLDIDISRDLYVRPEDRIRFQQLIEREGFVKDYEVEFKRKDGDPIVVWVTGHLRHDHLGNVIGYEGINVDQTERYRMERKLKEAHDFLNKIIQSSPNPIMAADLTGRIILWNRAAEKTLGYLADETVGKMHISRIYPEGVARKIMKMIRSSEHGGKGLLQNHAMLYVRRDGQVIDGTLSAAMIYDDEGREVATVGSFVDMTERIGMERALHNIQEQLLQSEKLAAMGKLTSQIAHELNNPLYGIMNTLELLKTEIPPENKRRRLLEMSLSETVRLADMLKKMLSFSKPDQEERCPANLNQIIEELLLLHERILQENNIWIVRELAGDLGEVSVSKNQMRQVILNMISNARDAMPGGGTLTFRTRRKGEQALIEIADTGQGIAEENVHRVFENFFTTKDSVKGVGLGLSVCYAFIQDHGGDITVQSKPNQGTTFTIALPAHKAENGGMPAQIKAQP